MPVPSHMADTPYPSPSAAPKTLRQSTRQALSLQDLEYLRAYIRISDFYPGLPEKEAEIQALTDAGFDTQGKSRLQLHKMRYDVLLRIDKALDAKSALEQAGLGIAAWVRLIYRMAEQDNWKVRMVAAKFWGLALGVFSDHPQGEGASITINVAHVTSTQTPETPRLKWPQKQDSRSVHQLEASATREGGVGDIIAEASEPTT